MEDLFGSQFQNKSTDKNVLIFKTKINKLELVLDGALHCTKFAFFSFWLQNHSKNINKIKL